jgi:glyoxylase-like metal-dependent hydrolase (beta-lactamase superfamily II)
MTAYALRDGEDTILVDPLVTGETEPLLAALDEIVRRRVRILVTTPFHVRGSGLLWRRWRDRHEVTIFGHEYRHRESEHRPTWYEQRFLPTLDALTRLDIERVLVTHGEPVLRDGTRALAASLARPPWYRSSLY